MDDKDVHDHTPGITRFADNFAEVTQEGLDLAAATLGTDRVPVDEAIALWRYLDRHAAACESDLINAARNKLYHALGEMSGNKIARQLQNLMELSVENANR